MDARQVSEHATFWGLPPAKWREITGLCLFLVAVIVLLSLVGEQAGQRWMGAVGDAMAFGAVFVFGRWVAFVLPALLTLAAFHAVARRSAFQPGRKAVASAMIVISLCALLTLCVEDRSVERMTQFEAGGVIGAFVVSDHVYGLQLLRYMGRGGATLVAGASLLLGIMLSTDFLLLPLMRHTWRTGKILVASRRKAAPVATLRFSRHGLGRVFPTIGKDNRGNDGAATDASAGPESGDAVARANVTPSENSRTLSVDRASDERSGAGRSKASPPEISALQRLAAATRRNGSSAAPLPEPPPPLAPEESGSEEMAQTELDFSTDFFEPPSLDLFHAPPVLDDAVDREEVLRMSAELEGALEEFNIQARVVGVSQGPVVTQYELQPAPGVKVSRVLSVENDIALKMRARSLRIQAPIPGKAAIGIEVPNRKTSPVYFRELIDSEEFRADKSPLSFPLGKDIGGNPVICNLADMPHLLIAGTTGSGKSVCVNAIISSILYRMSPDQVKFIMIDPKMVELNVYAEIPHLIAPVVNKPRQAAAALQWAVRQMEERLQLFSNLRVRNIDGYNAVVMGTRKRRQRESEELEELKYMPHIVIIIDELADLMVVAKKEVEELIVRLAQMSRAAGLHMILATQRPSVNVITGIIKANFPTRIAFQLPTKVDSRTILDMNGAETLLGRGDMLYLPGGAKPLRIQGAYISDEDVEQLTDYLRRQNPEAAVPTPDFPDVVSAETADATEEDDAPAPSDGVRAGGNGVRAGSNGVRAGNNGASLVSEALESVGSQDFGHVEFPSVSTESEADSEDEELYDKALRLILETRKPSVSMIQRRLKIGFARAGRLMDMMEERGVVGPYRGSKPRELLVEDPEAMLERIGSAG